MITIYSDAHRGHDPRQEISDGKFMPIFERPERALRILDAVTAARLGDIRAPTAAPLEAILRVHDAGLVRFLQQARSLWKARVGTQDMLPYAHVPRGVPAREPDSIHGKLGFYAYDAVTPLTEGSWNAALQAVSIALSGLDLVAGGEHSAFGLCRPPGHHSMRGQYGGYGLFNNAAVAAQRALDGGAARVAVLDVDVHHGNGTQDIFYGRDDVLYVSLHSDPRLGYPHFMGHADENGAGAGEGFNLNIPLPHGTGWHEYEPFLRDALKRIREHAPDILIVSLGVDTYDGDPNSYFKFRTSDYLPLGAAVASLRLPTLFVMEGGYDIEALGANVVNVLRGFEGG